MVGIGGQAGTGKSVVARCFAHQGAEVIDADRIGWDLLEAKTPSGRKVARAFGRRILDEHGSIDRRKLGAVVFSDARERARLNRIVHPALLAALKRRIAAPMAPNSETGLRIRVVDAALLFFWSWQRKVDCAILVTATRANKLERLKRAGLSRRAALARLGSQLTDRRMLPKADYVITNDGTIDELGHKCANAWCVIHDLALIKARWS